MTKTEQYQAAIQSLSSRSEVESLINEWQPDHESFTNALNRLQEVYDVYHEATKQKDIENLMVLMRAKGIDLADLTGVEAKHKKETTKIPPVLVRAVTDDGEIVEVTKATQGAWGLGFKKFGEYCKKVDITRKQISELTEEQWYEKFQPYLDKLK